MAAVGGQPKFEQPLEGVFGEQPLNLGGDSASASASPPPPQAASPPPQAASPPPTVRPTSVEDLKKLQFAEQPIVNLATCNLNQMALDFTGNQRRIIESIKQAKAAGCKYRLGPELEITGYSCEDHFYELDTITFAWMSLRDIILTTVDGKNLMDDILCDFGMPILHNGVRYNCRVFVLGRKILLIRPKMWMADDGNYREDRHFTPWDKDKIQSIEEYQLPEAIHDALEESQTTVPFGVAILQCKDATIGAEICEELFTAESTNILLGFEGCDIMSNGSASHFEVGKRMRRHDLIREATRKNGGVYMYSNMLGLDGNRMVFDGNGMIYMNGELKAVGEHLLFHEVEVVTAKLNLDEVRTFRAKSVSHQMQSDQRSVKLQRIKVDFNLSSKKKTLEEIRDIREADELGGESIKNNSFEFNTTNTIEIKEIPMEEEMGMAVSRWLFDYLTRSGSGSFLLPLSGGVDSSSTAMFVYFMCSILSDLLQKTSYEEGESPARTAHREFLYSRLDPNVFRHSEKFRHVLFTYVKPIIVPSDKVESYQVLAKQLPTAKDLMNLILYTVNMPTKNNTSTIMLYAFTLADALGSYHVTANIQEAFIGIKNIVSNLTFGTTYARNTPIDAATLADPLWKDIFNPKTGAVEPKDIVQIPRTEHRDGVKPPETLAIQNIQARLRMMTAFLLSQVLPLHRNVVEKMDPTGDLLNYQTAKATAVTSAMEASGGTIQVDKPEDYKFVHLLEKNVRDSSGNLASNKLHNDYKAAVGGAQMCLVLASSNSDEALRGFYTKYDAASADINPIGSFSKHDLRKFLYYCMTTRFVGTNSVIEDQFDEKTLNKSAMKTKFNNTYNNYPFKVLYDILTVTASPELQEPGAGGAVQDDELAIEVTYEDLYDFGIMRKNKLGPLGVFYKMCKDRLGKFQTDINTQLSKKFRKAATPTTIYDKVNTLFRQYGLNRHKMTILTPALHATDYSPDDNRFDQRPFLYPNERGASIAYQLDVVKKLAAEMEQREDVKALVAAAVDQNPEEAVVPATAAATATAAAAAAVAERENLGGGARHLRSLRRVTRDKKRDAKRRSQTRKS